MLRMESWATMNVGRASRAGRTFPAQPSSARAARQFVAEELTAHGAARSVIDDFTLAVSEVVSNTVAHSDDTEVEVCIDTTDPLWWHIEVLTHSPLPRRLRDPDVWSLAPASSPSGRGLGIVRSVMDEVSVLDAGSIVAMRRRRATP